MKKETEYASVEVGPYRPLLRTARRTVLPVTAVLAAACGQPPPEESRTAIGTPPSVAAATELGAEAVVLTEEQARTLSIRTTVVALEPVILEISSPGTVSPAPNYYAEVSAPVSGLITAMAVNEGDRVSRGQVVAELESLELAELASAYREAEAERVFAALQVERYAPLVDRLISPRSTLDEARADLSRAEARSEAALIRLRSLGVADRDIERWYASDVGRPTLSIRAPIDGVVGEHLIELGRSVAAYEMMMSVLSTERVLVQAFLSPEDVRWVGPGDSAEVTLSELTEGTIESSVTSIVPSLGGGSRSVIANIMVDSSGRLIPGQSVRVTIRSPTTEPLIEIPLSSIEHEGETAVVFIQGEDERTWIPRPVAVARMGEESAIIGSGVEPGDVVATTQVFTLKALARFADFGEEQ